MDKKIEVQCECEKDLDTAAQELRDSLGGNCETCSGNGYVPYNALSDTDCPACGGSGVKGEEDEGDHKRTARRETAPTYAAFFNAFGRYFEGDDMTFAEFKSFDINSLPAPK